MASLLIKLSRPGRSTAGGQPVVVIDGVETPAVWGKVELPIDPGQHSVSIYVRFLSMTSFHVDTTVVANGAHTVTIDYRTPWFIWQKVRLSVTG